MSNPGAPWIRKEGRGKPRRLEKAKAYREEEASNYFTGIAPLTKLFVVDYFLSFFALLLICCYLFVIFNKIIKKR